LKKSEVLTKTLSRKINWLILKQKMAEVHGNRTRNIFNKNTNLKTLSGKFRGSAFNLVLLNKWQIATHECKGVIQH
jgi:hypothetical protein